MSKVIQHRETLVYYDGPELFLASDQADRYYLCLLVECTDAYERFLCAPISSRRLADFYAGNLDLRTIYETPERGGLFYADVNSQTDQAIPLSPIRSQEIPESWLPEAGYFFEKDSIADDPVFQPHTIEVA